MPCTESPDNPKKIGGYDAWDVKDAVRTMQKSAEIEKDSKFLAVVVKEMGREADKLEDKAKLLATTQIKLNKVFKKGKS